MFWNPCVAESSDSTGPDAGRLHYRSRPRPHGNCRLPSSQSTQEQLKLAKASVSRDPVQFRLTAPEKWRRKQKRDVTGSNWTPVYKRHRGCYWFVEIQIEDLYWKLQGVSDLRCGEF